MPLIKSASKEAVSANIKEMVKSGMKPKQAIAAALSHQRQMKKMAMGGMVEDKMDTDDGSIDAGSDEMGMPGQAVYPEGDDEQGLSENVMKAQALAEGLQAARMKANDNSVSYEADDMVAGKRMADGGLVDDADGMHEMLGSKPEPKSGGPEAPMSGVEMSMGLSDEAKKALMAKKAKRSYRQ